MLPSYSELDSDQKAIYNGMPETGNCVITVVRHGDG